MHHSNQQRTFFWLLNSIYFDLCLLAASVPLPLFSPEGIIHLSVRIHLPLLAIRPAQPLPASEACPVCTTPNQALWYFPLFYYSPTSCYCCCCCCYCPLPVCPSAHLIFVKPSPPLPPRFSLLDCLLLLLVKPQPLPQYPPRFRNRTLPLRLSFPLPLHS